MKCAMALPRTQNRHTGAMPDGTPSMIPYNMPICAHSRIAAATKKKPTKTPRPSIRNITWKKNYGQALHCEANRTNENGHVFVTQIPGPEARYLSPFRRPSSVGTLRKYFCGRKGVEDLTTLVVDDGHSLSQRLHPQIVQNEDTQQRNVDELRCLRHRTAFCGPWHGTDLQAPKPSRTRFGGSGKAILPARPGPRPPGAGRPLITYKT